MELLQAEFKAHDRRTTSHKKWLIIASRTKPGNQYETAFSNGPVATGIIFGWKEIPYFPQRHFGPGAHQLCGYEPGATQMTVHETCSRVSGKKVPTEISNASQFGLSAKCMQLTTTGGPDGAATCLSDNKTTTAVISERDDNQEREK